MHKEMKINTTLFPKHDYESPIFIAFLKVGLGESDKMQKNEQ